MRCKTNALLEINHSFEQGYVDWKYRHLADLVRTPPKVRKSNGSANRLSVCHAKPSRADALLPLFYETGKKRVPEARALRAHSWRCGSWTMVPIENRGVSEYAAVRHESQQGLLRLLRDQWGIEAALNRDKSYYRIRLSVEGTARLAKLIEPHLLPEFRYKLPQVTP